MLIVEYRQGRTYDSACYLYVVGDRQAEHRARLDKCLLFNYRTERSAVLDDFLLLKIDRTERRTVLVTCLLLKIDRAYGLIQTDTRKDSL